MTESTKGKLAAIAKRLSGPYSEPSIDGAIKFLADKYLQGTDEEEVVGYGVDIIQKWNNLISMISPEPKRDPDNQKLVLQIERAAYRYEWSKILDKLAVSRGAMFSGSMSLDSLCSSEGKRSKLLSGRYSTWLPDGAGKGPALEDILAEGLSPEDWLNPKGPVSDAAKKAMEIPENLEKASRIYLGRMKEEAPMDYMWMTLVYPGLDEFDLNRFRSRLFGLDACWGRE